MVWLTPEFSCGDNPPSGDAGGHMREEPSSRGIVTRVAPVNCNATLGGGSCHMPSRASQSEP